LSCRFAQGICRRQLDADGSWGGGVTNTFYAGYDGISPTLELDGTTKDDVSHRYLWGAAVDQLLADEQVTSTSSDGNTLWPLADHLGTIRDIADYDGGTPAFAITNHRVYDSFGRLESETNSAVDLVFGFTGKFRDADTGLNNYLNRWYDSRTGKWLSEDPAGFAAGDTNLARYVGNSPTMYVDALGLVQAFAQNGSANTTSGGAVPQDNDGYPDPPHSPDLPAGWTITLDGDLVFDVNSYLEDVVRRNRLPSFAGSSSGFDGPFKAVGTREQREQVLKWLNDYLKERSRSSGEDAAIDDIVSRLGDALQEIDDTGGVVRWTWYPGNVCTEAEEIVRKHLRSGNSHYEYHWVSAGVAHAWGELHRKKEVGPPLVITVDAWVNGTHDSVRPGKIAFGWEKDPPLYLPPPLLH
jgi:RHS repeat-associated protein